MYNSVFISDVHLGTNRCDSKRLLSFLQELKTKQLVLVGDIIDITCMEKHNTSWKRQHTECVNKILDLLESGTKIIYISGNHEGKLREKFKFSHKNFTFCNEYVYKDSNGNKFLCIHGDKCSDFSSGSWKQLIFNWGYELITPLSHWLNKFFRFSLVYFLKNTIRGKNYITKYESDLVEYCKKHGNYKGVICGHIHHANMKAYENIIYMCCGDWVDTCSAIVEFNGKYEIKKYK